MPATLQLRLALNLSEPVQVFSDFVEHCEHCGSQDVEEIMTDMLSWGKPWELPTYRYSLFCRNCKKIGACL
jgi:hypothetical protein